MSERPKSRTELAIQDPDLQAAIADAWTACQGLRCAVPHTSARTACPQYLELAHGMHTYGPLSPRDAEANVLKILPTISSCHVGRAQRPSPILETGTNIT